MAHAPQSSARRGTRGSAPRKRRWLKLAALLVVPVLALAFAGLTLFFYVFASVPLPEDIGEQATVVLDRDGEQIAELQPHAGREDVRVADLPDHVVDAVLAAEDAGFYQHRGLSLPGIFRAAVKNVTSGEVRQGGSTISQQYIKNHTADAEQTALRKVREGALAVKLERRHSKDEILEFYLNSVYFGRGAYGIQAAARAYYDVDAANLDAAQAAQLAGLLPAPSVLDPAENPDGAARRYRYVLDRLATNGWLDPAEAERLADATPEPVARQAADGGEAPFFVDLVRTEVAKRVGEDMVYRGLTVTTTLDRDMQSAAEAAYADGFAGVEPTGALVSLDPRDGGVRALVGGKDHAADQLNLALQPRQPGSTFKPFALAAWIEAGNSPESVFDAPASTEFDTGEPTPWQVGNYGANGYGSLTLREATWRSVNTVYAQVTMDLGPREVARVAGRAGIDANLSGHPSIVLGTEDVTPLELAEAYNTFAAAGAHHEPTVVLSVTQGDATLFTAPQRGGQAVDRDVALAVTDVLRGVITSGTGTAADIGRPAAGKTGTTQGHGDAWFAGYTPALTTVVWMGHRDTNQPMPGDPTGGGLPAQVWSQYMRTALAGVPAEDFPAPPADLEVVGAEPESPDCPDGEVAEEVVDDGAVVDWNCVAAQPEPVEEPEPEDEQPEPEEPVEEPVLAPTPEPEPAPTLQPQPAPQPAPTPDTDPRPEPEPQPAPEPRPEPAPAAEPRPGPEPRPQPAPRPEPRVQPLPPREQDAAPPADEPADPAAEPRPAGRSTPDGR